MQILTDFNVMDWQQLINQIKRDFRLSDYDFETQYNISRVTVWNLSTGETKKPTPNTVKKLEEALKIKIDDSDPENISYTKVNFIAEEKAKYEIAEVWTEADRECLKILKEENYNEPEKLKKLFILINQMTQILDMEIKIEK